MNIYVGNISPETTGDDLQEIFGAFGYVSSIKIIKDKFTGESRGFGFVEMPDKREAQAAMKGITEIKGRGITINEARPQEKRGSHGGPRRGPRDKRFDRRERRY